MTDLPNRTSAYIDAAALRANLARVRAAVSAETAVMAIVKADAYGHGVGMVVPVLEEAGADWFGVATVGEGAELRGLGIRKPILVLYGILPEEAARALRHDLAVAVVDAAAVAPLATAVGGSGGRLRVHLEVDTGMTRLGVRPAEVTAVAAAIRASPGLELEGFFSHFGSADDVHSQFTTGQLEVFRAAVAELEAAGLRPRWVHLGNSAATLTRTDTHWDMVRPGVCLYGVKPANAPDPPLRPVMHLRSRVWRLWDVPAGRHVGYAQTFSTKRPTRIAVLPVGYADGYPRALSNRGAVLIAGQRAPVLGRVCMDVMMVDATDIAGVAEGDPVALWGELGDSLLTVDEVAAACDTIPYELLARVGKRVPKVRREEAG